MSNGGRRERCWADGVALAAVLVALLVIYRRLVVGRVLAGGDLQTYFFPYWTAAARALQRGTLPLWNPYLFAGAPLLANSQAGVFYPLNWPLWLLSGPTLDGMARTLHVSVLLHLGLAALTAYVLARRLGAGPWGGAVAGLLYAGGGFLGVHVEHLNQLQGLAWLPLVFLLQERAARWSPSPVSILALALILLAGHTQTAFIAAVGLLLFHVTHSFDFAFRPGSGQAQDRHAIRNTQHAIRRLLPFALAALIAAAQLLPTFELARFSMRAGGLPWREAVSFSVAPWQLPRALLPAYLVTPLLPEGVAYVGIVGLLLAGWGAWRAWRERRSQRLALVALGAMGLFLALGGYNPFYLLAARLGLPGVAQFRAPARYLALTTLSAAVLAGTSFTTHVSRLADQPSRTPSTSPFDQAQDRLRTGTQHATRILFRLAPLLFVLSLAELSFAAESLPHADATAPRAYTGLRPATAHLVAAAREAQAQGRPPGRFLSISKMLFQPGDEPDLELIYEEVLAPDALRSLLVSAKAREVLAPNLPLAFAVPAVDGYDGGLLPLRHYADFTELLLPGGTLDGRLRENLEAVPDERWLSLLDVRFLITDKTGDTWIDGVFYDRQFRPALTAGETLTLGWLPADFDATALHVLAAGEGRVTLTMRDGETRTFPVAAASADAPTVVAWDAPATPVTATFQGGEGGLMLAGATLVAARTEAFYPLVLSARFWRVHSGDVKLYENLDLTPRVFFVQAARTVSDVTSALDAMSAPDFDPTHEVVLLGDAPSTIGPNPPLDPPKNVAVEIAAYEPLQVVLDVRAPEAGYVVLTDAWFPGWAAEIAAVDADGAALDVPVLQADVLFRAVPVAAGRWRITLRYRPRALWLGGGVSAAGILGWAGYAVWLRRQREGRHD